MVRLNSNGAYWQAAWTTPDGRRVAKSLGAKSKIGKREARKMCEEIARRHILEPATIVRGQSPRLSAWIDEFLRLRTDLKWTSADEYRKTFDYLRQFFADDPKLEDITRLEVSRFRAWLAELPGRNGKMHENTLRKHMTNTGGLFSLAVDRDLCPRNPCDREKRTRLATSRTWKYVSIEDAEKIMERLPDTDSRTFFALLRLAGLRRNEVHRLEWENIDWQARTLTVRPEGHETTKQRFRVVPIVPRLLAILQTAWEEAPEGYPRVCEVGNGSVDNIFERAIKAAGLEPWSAPCHTLRKNCETDWLAEYPVMDVCRWMGHNPKVAAEHYHQTTVGTMAKVTGFAANDRAALATNCPVFHSDCLKNRKQNHP